MIQSLNELLGYPLVMCHPEDWSGTWRQMQRVLCNASTEPSIAAYVVSGDMPLSLVSAGHGVGFASEARVAHSRLEAVAIRTLAGCPDTLTTYLLRSTAEPSQQLSRFIGRAHAVGSAKEVEVHDKQMRPSSMI
ncbi:hypothetical protein EVC45_43565 [Paraburkholderia sp. UYCP14C]|uniref:LysR substrate-binding domain-containing protein n=1 Tax=Paraburkholderia sp. UYCP14C TaxID=2511130 RepID=UPI0010209C2B|nr:hypothetical protein EVC45_43565 [Paraburkholderia sp. UYCP14C]